MGPRQYGFIFWLGLVALGGISWALWQHRSELQAAAAKDLKTAGQALGDAVKIEAKKLAQSRPVSARKTEARPLCADLVAQGQRLAALGTGTKEPGLRVAFPSGRLCQEGQP